MAEVKLWEQTWRYVPYEKNFIVGAVDEKYAQRYFEDNAEWIKQQLDDDVEPMSAVNLFSDTPKEVKLIGEGEVLTEATARRKLKGTI